MNNKQNKITIIEILLIVGGFVMFQGCIFWAIAGDNDRWFSRLSVGLICFGLAGIMNRLRKL